MKLGPIRMVGQQWFALLLLLTSAFPQAKTSSNKAPLKTIVDQSLDSSSGTLYIAHINADHLVVF